MPRCLARPRRRKALSPSPSSPATTDASPWSNSWPAPNSIDLQWQGASDPGGYGVLRYDVHRNGAPMASVPCCDVTDAAVSPSTTYTYTIYAVDYFLNTSSGTTITVTTPSSSTYDPRRVGVRPTGSYWGGAGERLDTRSGNLNFTFPLVGAKGRGGWGVTFALSYNSQLWRRDSAATWKLGRDVGYGFGWRLMAGSITPYWSDPYTVHHYLFTDSSGAEYRLDVNAGGIWTTREGLYLEYEASSKKLFFPDGSFWLMGAVSSGLEQDAGARYPTLMQDTNGNQILIRYQQGQQSAWPDSSARISEIEDVRAVSYTCGPPYRTFSFYYNSDSIPHLNYIGNWVGTSESYNFTYLANQTLNSPFSPPVAFGTAHYLQTVGVAGLNISHTFEYAAGAGELTKVTFPLGASLRWAHRQFTYTGSRTFREVQYRYLRPSPGAAELTYTLTRDDGGDASRSFHAWARLGDPTGHATRWAFQTAASPSWSVGLASSLEIRPSATGTAVRKHEYTWSQDAAGTPYVSAVLTTLDPGQSYQKQSKTEQTLDTHGNLLQTKVYDYGNLSTPARTYNYTYYLPWWYPQYHLWNLLSSASVTGGGSTQNLASLSYDGYCLDSTWGPARQWVSPPGPRGIPCSSWSPGVSSSFLYDYTGNVIRLARNGVQVAVTPDSTKNYAVPSALTPNNEANLTTSLTYSAFLGVTSVTEPNASTGAVAYDGYARPTSVTSPHGAVTTYAYTYNPATATATTGSRWTKTTLDGFGRTVKVETGDGSGTKSIVDTEYAACACSPLGRVSRVSQPYAPGGTVYWTTYSYDCLGRTTSLSLPGGSGTTTYLYQGNTTTVTDPAGKWKSFKTNALGNLVQVTEPNPAGGADHETYYTYNLANKLTLVSMTRGSFTQTRTFVYDAELRLTSATNPENGTVSYVYNANHTLQKRTDAKNQRLEYTYDAYQRVTQIRKFNSSGQEDPNAAVSFTYDLNLLDPEYSQNAWGRRTTAQYRAGPYGEISFMEMYSYTAAGLGTKKKLRIAASAAVELEALWAYDNEGRLTSLTYPLNGGSYDYAYDSLGRPNGLTYSGQPGVNLVSGVSYGPAGQLTAMSWGVPYYGPWVQETRTYNPRLQLTRLTVPGQVDLEYRFSASQNNGQITQLKDWISGEEVSYAYDSLSRLSSATTTGPEWGQAYSYDGFGNRTLVTVTKGTAPGGNLTYDGMTNRITNPGFSYDANGNLTAMPGMAFSYDYDNRLAGYGYGYDPENRRVWTGGQAYFYGLDGRKLGAYQVDLGGSGSVSLLYENLYFAGRLIKSDGQWVVTDRLGSVVKSGTETLRYFPWGEERVTTAQNRTKFGTYHRDSSGLDYALNRYYSSSHGRFLTPDPYVAPAAMANPQSWNRYPYVRGDPVNLYDPWGDNEADPNPQTTGGGHYAGIGYRTVWGPEGSATLPTTALNPASPPAPVGNTGSGAAGRFIRVTSPSKTGPNQERIRNVMTWIGQNVDDDCADWLAGVGEAVAGLLGSPEDERTVTIGHGEFDTRTLAAITGNNPSQTDLPAGYGMTINDRGAFFVGSYTENANTYSLSVNGYVGGTSQAQVAILLHELAHMLNAQGFQSDFNNESAGAANDRLVRQHCQRTLNAAHNIP